MATLSYHTALFQVKRTQVQMLFDRSYNIAEDERKYLTVREDDYSLSMFRKQGPEIELNYQLEDFLEEYSSMSIDELKEFLSRVYTKTITVKKTTVEQKCFVWYAPDSTGDNLLRAIATLYLDTIKDLSLREGKIDEYISIANKEWHSNSVELLRETFSLNYWHFLMSELMANPTFHKFVPTHRLMSEEEKKAYLVENKMREKDLPRERYVEPLLKNSETTANERKSDPIVKYYGFRPGQLIEISRSNIFTPILVPDTLFYRLVSY